MAKKKLAAYQAKRDFKKTSEPTGKVSIQHAEYPRFIVQKHTAGCVTLLGWLYALSGLSAEVQRTSQVTWDRNRTVHVYEHAAR
jgi:hypothetical protein